MPGVRAVSSSTSLRAPATDPGSPDPAAFPSRSTCGVAGSRRARPIPPAASAAGLDRRDEGRGGRIHALGGYRWRFPVHEELMGLGENRAMAAPIEIRHLRNTAGARPHYVPLLRMRAAEHPDDGRTAHLLASEPGRTGCGTRHASTSVGR